MIMENNVKSRRFSTMRHVYAGLALGGLSCVFAATHNPVWTDRNGTRDFLAKHGYKHIQTLGYAWTGCHGDIYKTRFRAMDIEGRPVDGTVCRGFAANSFVIVPD